jgi:hypothetical protein
MQANEISINGPYIDREDVVDNGIRSATNKKRRPFTAGVNYKSKRTRSQSLVDDGSIG